MFLKRRVDVLICNVLMSFPKKKSGVDLGAPARGIPLFQDRAKPLPSCYNNIQYTIYTVYHTPYTVYHIIISYIPHTVYHTPIQYTIPPIQYTIYTVYHTPIQYTIYTVYHTPIQYTIPLYSIPYPYTVYHTPIQYTIPLYSIPYPYTVYHTPYTVYHTPAGSLQHVHATDTTGGLAQGQVCVEYIPPLEAKN